MKIYNMYMYFHNWSIRDNVRMSKLINFSSWVQQKSKNLLYLKRVTYETYRYMMGSTVFRAAGLHSDISVTVIIWLSVVCCRALTGWI